MAYGLKYWNEFKSYYDDTIRIEILGNGFSGSSTEIKTSETPLVISYPGSDETPYNPIVGSQAKIQMLSEVDFQFIELHDSDARAHRVDIYKNSVLDWRGWVLPDLFSEPYVAPPYIVEITARCGLGELKETIIPATMTEYTLSPLSIETTDQPRLLTILSNALGTIDTELDLNDAINVYSNETDNTDDSPLYETTIKLSAYEGKTLYDAISDQMLTFGARLYQMGAEWWIVRIKETTADLTVRKWNYTTTGYKTNTVSTTKNTSFLIGRPVASQILTNSPQLDLNPGWKEFNWVQDLGRKDSFLLNSDFSKWKDNGDPEDWDLSTSGIAERIQGQDFPYAEITTQNTLAARQYISQTIEGCKMYPIVSLDDRKLLFNFEFGVWRKDKVPDYSENAVVSQQAIICEFKFVGDSGTFYLKQNQNGNGNSLVWNTVQQTVQITVFGTGKEGVLTFDEGTFTADTFPGNGTFFVKIYNALSPLSASDKFITTAFKNISVRLLNGDGEDFRNEEITNILINQSNIYKPSDINVVGGDLPNEYPDDLNKLLTWDNGYRNRDGEATEEWHERGSAIDKPLLQLMGDDYKGIFSKPQFKLSVPILSQDIQFDSTIVDYQILPKEYICISADLDYRSAIFSGTFVEFAAWDGTAWILETGFWNDEGIWIDEDTWRDGDSDVIEYTLESPIYSAGSKVQISESGIGDTVETFPSIGSISDGNIAPIPSVPHVLAVGSVWFKIPVDFSGIAQTSFDVTISGILKRVIINLNI